MRPAARPLPLVRPAMPFTRLAMPAAATANPLLSMAPSFHFATGQVQKKETLRQREDRRRELSKLMESWQCTVGFEFHVQMNTKHKMFSSKFSSLGFTPCS